MSTEAEGKPPVNTAPDSHWYSHSTDAEQSAHEQVISEAQAVHEALATLGREAPAAQVRGLLKERGIDVEEPVIEHIRASLAKG